LLAFYAGGVLAGVAVSATLYAPAFAAITGWAGVDVRRRIRALTAVTLVAGLASTVFAPLTALLLDPLGWRGTYLVMAALVGLTAAAHWWGLRTPWPGTRGPAAEEPERHGVPGPQPFRAVDFRLLVAAMALGAFCVHAVVVNLVPLLLENGLTLQQAATVMAVGGIGQVTGRIFYGRLSTITGPAARAWLVLGVVALTTLALAEIHTPLALVALVAFAGGTARGLFTLVQATAISDRWGPRAFGARNSVLSGWTMGVSALAPWAGSFIADRLGGYGFAFWCLAAGMGVAAACIRPTSRRRVELGSQESQRGPEVS
jgi:predicted MFS family arabinose efflux permease